jgi:hypothetical protein
LGYGSDPTNRNLKIAKITNPRIFKNIIGIVANPYMFFVPVIMPSWYIARINRLLIGTSAKIVCVLSDSAFFNCVFI